MCDEEYERVIRDKGLVESEEYRQSLVAVICTRDPPHITLEELGKLVECKLKRGKFRPGLQKNVLTKNTPQKVISVTTRAFRIVDIKESIKILTELSYVGPATASFILAAYRPKEVPLMSDEALDRYVGTRRYDLKEYFLLLDEMRKKQSTTTMDDLEKAAYVHAR